MAPMVERKQTRLSQSFTTNPWAEGARRRPKHRPSETYHDKLHAVGEVQHRGQGSGVLEQTPELGQVYRAVAVGVVLFEVPTGPLGDPLRIHHLPRPEEDPRVGELQLVASDGAVAVPVHQVEDFLDLDVIELLWLSSERLLTRGLDVGHELVEIQSAIVVDIAFLEHPDHVLPLVDPAGLQQAEEA